MKKNKKVFPCPYRCHRTHIFIFRARIREEQKR